MRTPENSKELIQDLEEFGTLIKDTQRVINNARELILNNDICSQQLSGHLSRSACLHGMDHITASTMAEDFRGTMRIIVQDIEAAIESLGSVQTRLGSAEHIVHAIVHRVPKRPTDGVMNLK